jgi:urea transporter
MHICGMWDEGDYEMHECLLYDSVGFTNSPSPTIRLSPSEVGEMGEAHHSGLLTSGRVVVRGIGQVIFQTHAGTGILFLAGIVVASPATAVGALTGAVVGPALALVLRYDRQEVEDGIHGFNPTLVGIAVLFYLDPGQVLPWVLMVVGCTTATIVTCVMRRFLKFPTYTTPFIVCTWVLLLPAHRDVPTKSGDGNHAGEPAGSEFQDDPRSER